MTSITTSTRAGSAPTIRNSLTLDDLDFWMMLRRKHARHTYIPDPLPPIGSLRSMTAPMMWGSPFSTRFLLDVQSLLPPKPVSHPRNNLAIGRIAFIPAFKALKTKMETETKTENVPSGRGIAAFYHLLDFSVPLYRRPRPIKTPTFAWPSSHAQAGVTATPTITAPPRTISPTPTADSSPSSSPIISTSSTSTASPIVLVSVSPNIPTSTSVTLRTPTIPTPTPSTSMPPSTPTPTLMAGRNMNTHPRSKISSFFTSVTSKVSAALRLSAKRGV